MNQTAQNSVNHGDKLTENEIKDYANAHGFNFERVGNHVNGGMLLTLSQASEPIGMSFLLCDQEAGLFQRVY